MRVNLSAVADFYGVHRNTVRSWVVRGCPVEQQGTKGKETVFESSAVAGWISDQAVKNAVGDVDIADETELKLRKLRAETTMAEIEAMEKRDRVIPIDDAVKIVTNALIGVRQQLITIPSRVAPLIVGETDERIIRNEIGEEIKRTVEQLANRFYAVDQEPDEPGSQVDSIPEDPGPVERKRMGRQAPENQRGKR